MNAQPPLMMSNSSHEVGMGFMRMIMVPLTILPALWSLSPSKSHSLRVQPVLSWFFPRSGVLNSSLSEPGGITFLKGPSPRILPVTRSRYELSSD